LINRIVDPTKAQALAAEADSLPSIPLRPRQACDLEMIATGAFSPLEGFVGQADFESICNHCRLADGTIWPIPITLAVEDDVKDEIRVGGRAALRHPDGTLLAVIEIREIYPHDRTIEIPSVYRTEDGAHPGVKAVLEEGDWLVAGPIEVITPIPESDPGELFPEFRLPPAETRRAFEDRGWHTIVAFQTRNPIHRAHEYLTKCALENCDGLLIHPLVGETQEGDIPADVRMACYQVLIDKYYVPKCTMLSVMPGAMRYAGPREAILHALVRRNYGCSHFIVGRDHAGVGNYYGTYDAQRIFDEFDPAEIGITPLKYEHAAWCNPCEGMTSARTCPHGPEDKVFLSGTKVREKLRAGERPPQEFTRPEVADVLIRWATSQVSVAS
jgi:sulfate adenylyltransferase